MNSNLPRTRSHWKRALLAKDLEWVRALHGQGANLEWKLSNEFGTHGKMSALQLACLLDWTEGALWLISQGACVDVFTRAFATPLSFAVKGEEIQVARAILQKSTHTLEVVSAWDESPLHIAACNDDTDMLRLLLDHGASLSRINSEGKTALDVAIDAGCGRALHVLREHIAASQRAILDAAVPHPGAAAPFVRL